MSDAKFYEDLARFMTDSMIKVREHDCTESIKQLSVQKEIIMRAEADERAQTIESIVAVVEGVQPNNDGEDSYQRRIIAAIRAMDK